MHNPNPLFLRQSVPISPVGRTNHSQKVVPAISKELASPINQGVDISDTVWEGVPFFSKYADDLVEMAVKTNKDIAARVKLVRALLRDIQHEVHAFRESFRVPAATDGGSSVDARSEGGLGLVSGDIDRAFANVLKRVQEAFPGLDKAAHHDDRQHLIAHILAEAEIELVEILCTKYGLADEGVLRGFWRTVSPVIGTIVVAIGDLAEQHPWLAKFVVMGLMSVLVSESWFTRPLLHLIGLGPEQGEYTCNP
ncbi:hypothetical protein EYR40_003038 [Pleurotus pulmonarius]|nr:hypothetical protein EYR40_003038 [Pleurotus pulmonarius]